MEIDYFYTHLIDGTKLRDGQSNFRIKRFPIGTLSFPSGKIVACDPLLISNFEFPFHQEVSPGKATISLVISENLANNDERIAAAILNFQPLVPKNWVMATRGKQTLADLQSGEIFGYGVDSGTGSFMDLESANALVRKLSETKTYYEELVNLLNANYQFTRAWTILDIDPARKLNAALFFSGYGDGLYSSYWGYARDDSVVCLITDFWVFDNPEIIV